MGLTCFRVDKAFDGDRVLPDGALVLVRDELIVGVESGSAAAPSDCEVIHLQDATLLPGLIDTHVHLCGDSSPSALDKLPGLDPDQLAAIIDASLTSQLAAGVTAVRDLGDMQWAVVERRETPAGRPWIVASGPPITNVDGHCSNMGGAVAGRDAIVDAVRQRAERGADVVKVMTSGGIMTSGTDLTACNFADDEVRLMVDEAHRHGLPIVAHAHAVSAVQQSISAGVDGIEHCSCFTGTALDMPAPLATEIATAGIPVCPTIGFDPDLSIGPELQAAMALYGLTFDDVRAYVAGLYRAGIHLVSGTDAGISPAKTHGVLRESVIDLAAAGMPADEALATATGGAADAIGLGDRTGRLRVGLAADLLIVGGNPLADLTALRDVRVVVSVGTSYVPTNRRPLHFP